MPRMEYAPNGGPALVELGTGATSRFTYDPETLRLARLVTQTADQTAVQDLTYTYDPVGNVMAVANPLDVPGATGLASGDARSEEHTSELQSLMRISYAVFCLKKKKKREIKQYY